MSNKAAKGSAFERQVCKDLSLWFSGGDADDLFWRTAGSGGRATNRGRHGKRTAGAYGDIAATDERGAALLRYFTLELKRGYNRATIQDLLDKPPKAARQPYELWVEQAEESAKLAGSFTWAVIFRRDKRVPMILLPLAPYADLFDGRLGLVYPRAAVYVLRGREVVPLLLLPLGVFLADADLGLIKEGR